LLEVLGQQGIALAENAKIDIQHIIKAVTTAYFNRNIPSVTIEKFRLFEYNSSTAIE
jgi:hypothetical protein